MKHIRFFFWSFFALFIAVFWTYITFPDFDTLKNYQSPETRSALAFFLLFPLLVFCLALFLMGIRLLFQRFFSYNVGKPFWKIFVTICACFGFIFFVPVAISGYYYFCPAHLANITLSNGKQTLHFLQMSHIATSEFYTHQYEQIQALNNSGTIFLVEGVATGSHENTEKLYEKVSFKITPTLYKNISDFLSLEAQDNEKMYRNIQKERLHSVDMSVDDIAAFFPDDTGEETTAPLDIEKALEQFVHMTNTRQKNVYRVLTLSLLNMILKNQEILASDAAGADGELMQALLTSRNTPVVEYILQNPDKTIVIPYGALHFQGIFSSLVSHDANWQIIATKETTPYR